MLRAPRSTLGPLDPAEQQQAVAASPLQARYGQPLDRDSAYERLATRMTPPAPVPDPAPAPRPPRAADSSDDRPARGRRRSEPEPAGGSVVESVLKSSAFRSFARSAASTLGREVTRGIFGTRRRR
jgi:hypothetical protein